MASALRFELNNSTSSTRYRKVVAWISLMCWILSCASFHKATAAPSYLPPESLPSIVSPVPSPDPAHEIYPKGLTADKNDSSPLGTKTPIVLVHGWNSDASKWKPFSEWFSKSSLPSQFKLYRFAYQWQLPIENNGVELDKCIVATFGTSRPIVIVAHSMGGLVARSALENYTGQTSDFVSRVQRFIAIATPHHGSPLSNIAWLQNFSKLDQADEMAKILASSIFVPLDNDGGYSLGWDNYDRQMPSCVWEGRACSIYDLGADPPAANRFTRILNENLRINPSRPTLLSKYIFYAGYRNQCDTVSAPMLGYWAIKDHNLASGALLSYYFFNEKRQPIRSYVANDGVVPLSSALLLPSLAYSGSLAKDGARVIVDEARAKAQCPVFCRIFGNEEHIDHNEIPEKTSVFEALEEDLLAPLNLPANVKITIPQPTPQIQESSPIANISPILVIDRSGSISDQPGVMQQVQSRAVDVVNAIQKNNKEAAVINFSGTGNAAVDADFTLNRAALLKAIRNPSVGNNGTAIYDAINHAVELAAGSDKKAMVILFTDGENNAGSGLRSAILRCKKNSVPVVIVGFVGSGGRDEDALTELALGTFGFYVHAENLNIEDVLSRFQKFSGDKAGSAPDGLPN